ncbi:MAG: c-type cytochrome [Desulfuromonadales bacterium]|nr:c-type cytochrome [Desulfuromonadales bacterium]
MSSAKGIPRKLLQLTVVTTLLVYGCGEQPVTYPARRMPAGLMQDVAQLQAGQKLFRSKCASCHGKPSEGRSERAAFFNPPAPDFTGAHYRETDPAYLYWRIEVGKTVEPYRSQGSVMPAWGVHFSEEKIWQIVAYLQVRAH